VEKEGIDKAINWGTVAVYSCPKSCQPTSTGGGTHSSPRSLLPLPLKSDQIRVWVSFVRAAPSVALTGGLLRVPVQMTPTPPTRAPPTLRSAHGGRTWSEGEHQQAAICMSTDLKNTREMLTAKKC
jgi:hypothetical protein